MYGKLIMLEKSKGTLKLELPAFFDVYNLPLSQLPKYYWRL